MARPLHLDLRERVVAQVARGMTREEVAELNGIVSSTVTKWWNRALQTGGPAAPLVASLSSASRCRAACLHR
jgi:transposase